MKRSSIVAVLALVLSWLAAPAEASCAPPPPLGESLAQAKTVFVGTVVSTTNSDRWAMVSVEEIWRGRDLPAMVEVRAGPADPPGPMSVASSVDRYFKEGTRYLFVPTRSRSPFRDSSCSPSRRFTPRLAAFRPPAAEAPDAGEPEPVGSLAPWLVGGIVAAFVAALGIALLRRGQSLP